ncbi:MAG TPA: hypothetical protein VLH87_05425 [Pyrinomonadaceae bacterium]|nr:hypothetical protein [Pyrinomonadaceae bacterium]
MATQTPPPYFPQSSLSPPDENRYRKFKLAVVGIAVLLISSVGAAVAVVVYLIKRVL